MLLLLPLQHRELPILTVSHPLLPHLLLPLPGIHHQEVLKLLGHLRNRK
jgi:hypothetical protein